MGNVYEKNKKEIVVVPDERIINRIFLIRGKKVMVDKDLAELYKVKAIALRQAVKRNLKRFPPDFMFQLNKEETKLLVSHFVIPSMKYFGGHLPYVFTEQGVAMLSSVLNSDREQFKSTSKLSGHSLNSDKTPFDGRNQAEKSNRFREIRYSRVIVKII